MFWGYVTSPTKQTHKFIAHERRRQGHKGHMEVQTLESLNDKITLSPK